MKFSIKDFFSKFWPNPQFPADLVTFTEEILNGKLHFLCSVTRLLNGWISDSPLKDISFKAVMIMPNLLP